MSWKNILKREKTPLVPDEAMFDIPTGNLKSPPESRYFENAKVTYMESGQFVFDEIDKRYIMTDKYKRGEVAADRATMGEMDGRQVVSFAPRRVAKDAFIKVFDPYMDFMQSWHNLETLQEANKEWEYLTHRVMLTVHTALNNLFPTVEDAYKSRKLNGFLHWKGEYYQNLMNEKLPDTMEQIKPAKKQPSKKEPPKKRDYMAERREKIKRLRRDRK
tara:strand:+ start:786 stop:1436 length:651 start_codon:yes stop_codon:yes gene_type:complete